ncbi:uncharacterized protein HMPREF1541_03682 [Cyphellophora europaea CBS 101466]|uniref:Uncharacterized protein n=1 Tax=Cyphellophora europaea (strain CBS 101466) TaxID=1220924 RepID=W2RZH6_CYPE1|nr:uncharacterized protein HMPREF1541_03682 [Cyphellophora europaea CBS 101466]ETN41745.1 hypothetical protein HMPREF1541_03682 [Cyphellophora europaea CBS 101466]
MPKSWPPSPTVEDEVSSLAKEFGADSTDSNSSHGIPPAESRGLVDQYPLIIDVGDKSHDATPKVKEDFIKPTRLPTPPHDSPSRERRPGESNTSREEKRFVHIPATSDNEREIPQPPSRPRSKSTIGIAADEPARGRPHVHRINTDIGGDLRGMKTGQRRAPSPYAYRVAASNLLASAFDDKSKVELLSPGSAATPRATDAGRRARSKRPHRSEPKAGGSDTDKQESYRRHRSKSRVDRGSFSKHPGSSGDERTTTSRPEVLGDAKRRSERSLPRDRRPIITHRSAHGNITPPQTPGHPKESPYASAAEDSDRRRHHERRMTERRHSKESPYTSANEGLPSRREYDEKTGTRSRRQSVHRRERPHIDLSDQRPFERPDSTAPSVRTPRNLEADFEKAFRDNQKKISISYGSNEVGPSPLTSPPTSPPRTPRGERKVADYFGDAATSSAATKQRSRPPSLSENPMKPMTTLLGAATYGAATLASKAIPSLSRSSTTSGETYSSCGSQGSIASGQRSRKPSPVYEDPRPMSRAGPVSRAGSTASQDALPNRASTYPGREERPVSRNATAPLAIPHPPSAQRASSYSTIPEQAHLRPSARRTYSTTSGTTISVASSGPQGRVASSNLSQSSYTASSVDLSTPTEKHTAVSPTAEQKRPISFPMCPRPYAATGVQGWYTISGLANFDICPNCMRVLGESSLRDYCVPSQWKLPTEAVTCALSRPWVRIVVARCLKDGVPNVGLLQSLTTLPPDVYPCPGRQPEVRRWYHVVDPNTKVPVQGFSICTACVRSAELVFPELWKEKVFDRPDGKLAQERYCNLFSGSKHFYSIVNELDLLARYSKKKDLRPKDITAFGEFVRQKARTRECAKDSMLATPLWHFISNLPEFTICEECYEDVVWPLREKPIARDVSMTLQKVPVQRPANYVAGISCQLYSERMRRIFKDAVARNDMDGLKHAALTRYNIEHRLQENQRRYEMDQRAGYDRRIDIQRNLDYWKQYE